MGRARIADMGIGGLSAGAVGGPAVEVTPQCASHLSFDRQATANDSFFILRTYTADIKAASPTRNARPLIRAKGCCLRFPL